MGNGRARIGDGHPSHMPYSSPTRARRLAMDVAIELRPMMDMDEMASWSLRHDVNHKKSLK